MVQAGRRASESSLLRELNLGGRSPVDEVEGLLRGTGTPVLRR
ncbi:MAG: hypothetical protein ACUVV4_03080 [Candidatus Bathyarchaeia archaeon]